MADAADADPGLLPRADPLTVEGMDAGLIAALRAPSRTSRVPDAAPRAAAGCSSRPAGRPRGRGGRRRREAVGRGGAVGAVAGRQRPGRAAGAVADPRGRRRPRRPQPATATRRTPGWEDAAVPPERLGAYLRDFDALLARARPAGAPYGHFGDGCVHVRIDFDLRHDAAGVAGLPVVRRGRGRTWSSRYGGSLSGEHGDGAGPRRAAAADVLRRRSSTLFERVKGVWDPDDLLNPGVLVRPAPLDEDLRVLVGLPTAARRAGARVRRHDGGASRRGAPLHRRRASAVPTHRRR